MVLLSLMLAPHICVVYNIDGIVYCIKRCKHWRPAHDIVPISLLQLMWISTDSFNQTIFIKKKIECFYNSKITLYVWMSILKQEKSLKLKEMICSCNIISFHNLFNGRSHNLSFQKTWILFNNACTRKDVYCLIDHILHNSSFLWKEVIKD